MLHVDPPGPVTSLSVTLLPDSDGVQITWQTVENQTAVPVLGYIITYQVIVQSIRIMIIFNSPQNGRKKYKKS